MGGFFAASSPGNVIDVCSSWYPATNVSVRNGALGSNSSCEAAESLQGSTGDRDRPDRCMTHGRRSANCIRDEGYVAHSSRQLGAALPLSPECAGRRAGGEATSQGCPNGAMQEAGVRQIAYNGEIICSFVALIFSVSLRKQHEKVQMLARQQNCLRPQITNSVTFWCQDDY